jgi:hypothetical protein
MPKFHQMVRRWGQTINFAYRRRTCKAFVNHKSLWHGAAFSWFLR